MKKLFFTATMISTLFCSCEKENTQDQMQNPAELRFSNVATMDVLTRAASPYAESFKINVTADENQSELTGVEVTKNSDAWEITSPVYLQKTSRDLTAWAPEALMAEAGTPNVFALSSALFAAEKDLMYAPTMKVNSTAATVSLVLKHAYARMTFKLVKDNYVGGILNALSVMDVIPTAKIDIATGTVSDPAAVAPLEIVSGGTAAFAEQSVLVIPAVSSTPNVKCTLDDKEYEVALPVSSLIAGTNYVVTLKINGTQMGVASVNTEDWTNSESDVELK